MKKKPSLIFSILINILNNLDLGEEYSINEISEKAGLHWNTTKDYLDIIFHLFKFSPKAKFNFENNKIKIIDYSKFQKGLSLQQRILINLYEQKAFNTEIAMNIQDFFPNIDLNISLEELSAKELIKEDNAKSKHFITKSGQTLVLSLYSEMSDKIFALSKKEEAIENDKSETDFKIDNLVIEIKELKELYTKLYSQNRGIYQKFEKLSIFLEKAYTGFSGTQELIDLKTKQNREQNSYYFVSNRFYLKPEIQEELSSNDNSMKVDWDEDLKTEIKRKKKLVQVNKVK